jgi:hypothetical protein
MILISQHLLSLFLLIVVVVTKLMPVQLILFILSLVTLRKVEKSLFDTMQLSMIYNMELGQLVVHVTRNQLNSVLMVITVVQICKRSLVENKSWWMLLLEIPLVKLTKINVLNNN